ncbi:MAG: cupin domain-containing protein [Bacteroidales bacterium]|nr:cupin domain-containing protein [Bacteroidales bacterium]MCD4833028.1 cupin domain-containing protein [Bacteroidales bacterium]
MKTKKYTEAEARPNPHGVDARNIYDGDHAIVTHILLQPGEQLKKHITPVDAIFYVLEGTGIVEVGDEQLEVTKDTLIDSPAKIPHCWYNKSNEILRILVTKVPRPDGPTKLL